MVSSMVEKKEIYKYISIKNFLTILKGRSSHAFQNIVRENSKVKEAIFIPFPQLPGKVKEGGARL